MTRSGRVLRAGELAPDFELRDETGSPRRLGDLLGDGPVVLIFYPAASSYGCTRECRHFRDQAEQFAAVGARRIGVSGDEVSAQAAFASGEHLGFPLLSDAAGEVARAYGVHRRGPIALRRRTFVIDTDRRIIAVISSETRMGKHARGALVALGHRPAP